VTVLGIKDAPYGTSSPPVETRRAVVHVKMGEEFRMMPGVMGGTVGIDACTVKHA